MRNDAAARQASDMERILQKALINLVLGDPTTATIVANIGAALVEAYALGAIEAVQVAPWECHEVAYPERPEPHHLNIMAKQGWEPWDIANVMMPKRPGMDKDMLGFLVRFKRRVKPQEQPERKDA